ncbi:MAG: LysR family transcriptional regulator [Myxococcales bacterium]|nr:LysR family transcriptional regulator [Myxococcales bacterium]
MNKRLHGMVVFAVVGETGSFAAAARTLGKAPSVVSMQVRELEREFEARLLHRTTRRLALTEAGARYLPLCQEVLAILREAEALRNTMRTRVEGRLRLTVPSALLDVLVSPTLQVLLERHPKIAVELQSSDAHEELDRGEVDVAIRVGQLTQLGHRVRRLGELREVRVRRGDSPDRAIILPWQDQAPLAAEGVLCATSVAGARSLVAHGLGWATLPEPAVRELLNSPGVQQEGEGQPSPVYVVHAFEAQPPPQVRAFISAVITKAGLL